MVELFDSASGNFDDETTRFFDSGVSNADFKSTGNYEFANVVDPKDALKELKKSPGIEIIEDYQNNRFPMPNDVMGRDNVAVGRLRTDISHPNGLELWLCGDQIRKGAALNAVQIAELLIPKK